MKTRITNIDTSKRTRPCREAICLSIVGGGQTIAVNVPDADTYCKIADYLSGAHGGRTVSEETDVDGVSRLTMAGKDIDGNCWSVCITEGVA